MIINKSFELKQFSIQDSIGPRIQNIYTLNFQVFFAESILVNVCIGP